MAPTGVFLVELFDKNETALTPTAGTLSNSNPNQGLTFPNWGTPERQKINALLEATNQIQAMRGVL